MIPALGRPRVDRATRTRLALVLAQGPWCWPLEGDAALGRAREISGIDCPSPRHGDALLLAIGDSGPSLWALHVGDATFPGEASFGPGAQRAWLDATAALPRSVPVLWDSLARLGTLRLSAVRLSGLPDEGTVDAPESVLDGASFGMSFLLSMASCIFRSPLPGGLAAAAALDASGEARPVDGLEDKIRILRDRAPRVRRLLVASTQASLARSIAGPALEVIPIRSAGEALDHAFSTELSSLLLREGSDPARRSELVHSFFRLAIAGRGAVVDWTPVHQAARIAADHWDLDPAQKSELTFVRMVAARHEGRGLEEGIPDEAWIAGLPAPVRVDVVAHLVQQSADAGFPDKETALTLARAHLVRGKEAFLPHLRLLGAMGRLLARSGDLKEAMEVQREAALGWWDRMELSEISYPVSEWLRLCGATADPDAFDKADTLVRRITTLQPESGTDNPYVRLSRCRALVQLGRGAEAEPALEALFADASQPAHVIGASGRWLARAFDARGDFRQADRIRGLLRSSALAHPGTTAWTRAVDLAQLDLALRAADPGLCSEAIDRLGTREAGLVRSLEQGAPQGNLERSRWLSEVYPY